MRIVALDAIQVAKNRQRREFDIGALAELKESIIRFGLLHPVVVREEGDGWVLVAGERRLRAILDLHELGDSFSCDTQPIPVGHIPIISLGELNEIDREEAELEENVRRVDLSWQERAAATARLASLRGRQAESRGELAPPIAAIALEVKGSAEGIHHETTRREILLARHLSDPEVAGAKNLNDAWKSLKRKEGEERRRELAETVGETYSAATAHLLLRRDALDWLSLADAEHYDVICTDPPYGIRADEFGDSGGHVPVEGHGYSDDYDTWKGIVTVLAKEGYRICKPAAHLYIFCDITRFEELKYIVEEAGWKPFRTPIIWHKPNGNRLPWVDSGPQRKWEMVLYAKKGGKQVTRIYPDLVSYTADANLGHAAQKPVDLYVDLLKRSVAAGDKVLDPFAGSCPILPAAHQLKCYATAVEQDAASYAIGVQRLKDLSDQPELAGLV